MEGGGIGQIEIGVLEKAGELGGPFFVGSSNQPKVLL